LIRSHSCWPAASSTNCSRSASTRWAARRPWASRKELRSVPRAAAARSSRSRSSSLARSSIRLVLAGRWPCGLVLVMTTNHLERTDSVRRLLTPVRSAQRGPRSAFRWQRCCQAQLNPALAPLPMTPSGPVHRVRSAGGSVFGVTSIAAAGHLPAIFLLT
jgi:hypothetical protein